MLERISAFRAKNNPVFDLSVDHFTMLAEWYHFPILQMIGEPCFSADPRAIADRLGIHAIEAEAALGRLERLRLIEVAPNAASDATETGPRTYRKLQESVRIVSPVAIEAIRHYHSQMLTHAIDSLSSQTPDERLVQTQTVAFDLGSLAEVDRLTDEYHERVVQLSELGKKRDQIYHLSTVFFNLTQPRRGAVASTPKVGKNA